MDIYGGFTSVDPVYEVGDIDDKLAILKVSTLDNILMINHGLKEEPFCGFNLFKIQYLFLPPDSLFIIATIL